MKRWPMKKILAAAVLAGVGSLGLADAGAADAWWNAEWACRAKVTVNSGFYKRHDALLSQEIHFDEWLKKAGVDGAFDGKSPRVLWLHGDQQEEVQSHFDPAPGSPAQGTLLWERPGVMPAMTQEQFFIYFDALRGAPKPEPKPCSLELPHNLIGNGDFGQADPKNPAQPLGWTMPPPDQGSGERVKGISHSGQWSLKLTNVKGGTGSAAAVSQVVRHVRSGRRYQFSAWIKQENAEGGLVIITADFHGAVDRNTAATKCHTTGGMLQVGHWWVPHQDVPWFRLVSTSIEARDLVHKIAVYLPRTAPGTDTANISLSAHWGKMTLYFDDVELKECPEGAPIQITVGALEKK